MKTLLWLDDFRDPFDRKRKWLNYYAPEYLNEENKIVWAKNANDFIEWIEANGLPDKIGFDHDLADEHYAPESVYAEAKYNEWAKTQNFKEKTGMDCAKWLVEHCMDNELELPMWVIQSANPNGAKNISSYLLSYMKHVESNQPNDSRDAVDGPMIE